MSFQPASTQASSSTHPQHAISASYHPLPRPTPKLLPNIEPVDTQAVKQELHDALGENGLPYWKAMNGYLLGRVGRKELEGMVRKWLAPSKVYLHNALLLALLRNASAVRAPPSSALLSAAAKKRKRVPPDHPEYDTDDVKIEPKARVTAYLSSLTVKDRLRLKRLIHGKVSPQQSKEGSGQGAGASAGSGGGSGEIQGADGKDGEDGAEEWRVKMRGSSAYTPRVPLPPSSSDRLLPSSSQLSSRLVSLASAHGLSIDPDALGELGEFMAVGLDAHLVDILHGLVHLTASEEVKRRAFRIENELEHHLDVSLAEDRGRGETIKEEATKQNTQKKQKTRRVGLFGLAHAKEVAKTDSPTEEDAGKEVGLADEGEANGVTVYPKKSGKNGKILPIDGEKDQRAVDVEEHASEEPGAGDTDAQNGSRLANGTGKPAEGIEITTSHPHDNATELSPSKTATLTNKVSLESGPSHHTRSTTAASRDASSHSPFSHSDTSAHRSHRPRLPKPTVSTLQSLFSLAPSFHPQVSPALYKLGAGQYGAEAVGRKTQVKRKEDGSDILPIGLFDTPIKRVEKGQDGQDLHAAPDGNGDKVNGSSEQTLKSNGIARSANGYPSTPLITDASTTHPTVSQPVQTGSTKIQSPPTTIQTLRQLRGPHRMDQITKFMQEQKLLMPDKAEDAKKRHSHHWKYEDPALVMRDILG